MTNPYAAPPVERLAEGVSAVAGQAVAEKVWVIDQLSRVAAFRLGDGSEVVAKARPYEPRLAACTNAQARAAARGIPCPRPWGSVVLDDWSVTVEDHRPGGGPRPVQDTGIQVLVELCLALDDAIGDPGERTHLGPGKAHYQPTPPPWADPLHEGPEAWPARDPRLPDLRDDRRAPWLWDAAERVRRRAAEADGPFRVGHLDFYTSNFRWGGGRVKGLASLVSLDDWDSLGVLPEPLIVGHAAGVFTTTREPFTGPTIAQTREFLERWLATSQRTWSREEQELAWAAGLWNRIFDAQDGLAHGNPTTDLDRARSDIEERLSLAGA